VLSRILHTVREHALLERGDRVLVAVSGGPDSTALLHGLLTLSARLGISVQAACVDHGLRAESADEARGVEARCQALGLSCAVVKVDVGRARRSHVSTQEAARVVRLAALQETATRLDCNKVALGHTADDQAETVLFRILRGTGLAGLAGIPYQREPFVRPLLDVRRAELLGYLAKRKIAFVSDPSNANRRYARSRIRHDILPMLTRENPRVAEALLALSHEAQGRGGGDWRDGLPDGTYVPRRAVETVERLLREGAGTRYVAAKNGEIVVRYGHVSWLAKPAVAPSPAMPTTAQVILPTGGQFRLFEPPAPAIEVLAACPGPLPTGNHACFDVAQMKWPLCLRPWQPGDRMALRSGRGTRKLSDLLIDAKVPRRERSTLPLLCDAAGTILFVPGLRPSEVGRPNVNTQEWIEVRVAR
jgi:tRNA(Ile)-lysidine synthase